jgi:hypothetical protein
VYAEGEVYELSEYSKFGAYTNFQILYFVIEKSESEKHSVKQAAKQNLRKRRCSHRQPNVGIFKIYINSVTQITCICFPSAVSRGSFFHTKVGNI